MAGHRALYHGLVRLRHDVGARAARWLQFERGFLRQVLLRAGRDLQDRLFEAARVR